VAADAAVVAADSGQFSLRMMWVVAVLGACFMAVRAGLGHAPVLWFAALRVLVGCVVLAGLWFVQRRRMPRGWSQWAVIAGRGLVIVAPAPGTRRAPAGHSQCRQPERGWRGGRRRPVTRRQGGRLLGHRISPAWFLVLSSAHSGAVRSRFVPWDYGVPSPGAVLAAVVA
jgi:hypothetical protein